MQLAAARGLNVTGACVSAALHFGVTLKRAAGVSTSADTWGHIPRLNAGVNAGQIAKCELIKLEFGFGSLHSEVLARRPPGEPQFTSTGGKQVLVGARFVRATTTLERGRRRSAADRPDPVSTRRTPTTFGIREWVDANAIKISRCSGCAKTDAFVCDET